MADLLCAYSGHVRSSWLGCWEELVSAEQRHIIFGILQTKD